MPDGATTCERVPDKEPDAALRRIVQVWPALSPAVRASILALVASAPASTPDAGEGVAR